MKLIRFILLIFLIILLINSTEASHIVGGEVYYSFVKFNANKTQVTYNIDIELYRENVNDINLDFEISGQIGIYELQENDMWILVDSIEVDRGDLLSVSPPFEPCVVRTGNFGVEMTSYEFEYTFDINGKDYLISYRVCCRNNTINNIRNPGTTDAIFDILLTHDAQLLGNSSPRFRSFPPINICRGDDFRYDHSAIDLDGEGDELRYSFCAPFRSGCSSIDLNINSFLETCPPDYPIVEYGSAFNARQPIGRNTPITIDPVSGLIEAKPDVTGLYVIGVCMNEFRDGVLLSTVRRDFQIEIVICTPIVVADLGLLEIGNSTIMGIDDCRTFEINSCGTDSISIVNRSIREDSITTYHWTFYDEDGTVVIDSSGGSQLRNIDVAFPEEGQYSGSMIINEGSICADIACIQINIFPDIEADFSFEYDTCMAGPVSFIDQSNNGDSEGLRDWKWIYDEEEFSFEQNPIFQFPDPGIFPITLSITDQNGCVDELEMDIDYRPAPSIIIVEPSSFVGCSPSDVSFNNLSTPIDSTYEILWDFGDGSFSSETNPTHLYEVPGIYTISLEITSPLGCTSSQEFPSLIRVLEGASADFSFSPEEPNNIDSEVQFTDLSMNADRWRWEFGDIGTSILRNPSFDFPEAGLFPVKLTSFHPISNCPDTITKLVDVKPLVMLFLPNAFTPNNDGKNESFRGTGFLEGLFEYEMTIWNRWGEKVFESTDSEEGWNGRKHNIGEESPQGVYVYKISFITVEGEEEIQRGQVTLLR